MTNNFNKLFQKDKYNIKLSDFYSHNLILYHVIPISTNNNPIFGD